VQEIKRYAARSVISLETFRYNRRIKFPYFWMWNRRFVPKGW